MFISGGSPAQFGFLFSMIAAIILIAAWVILASSRFVQGGVVERPERVPQLYGYTVCLVALIWALASVISLVDATLSLSAPELRSRNDYGFEASVTSFEAFRTTYDQQRRFTVPNPNDPKLDSIPEAELRRRYESLREDRVRRARYEARRDMVVGALSFVIALALFAFHWRWLKRYAVVQPS